MMQTNQASSREWIGLAVLTLPCVVYAMDLTVLFLAVPQLSAALQPGAAQLLWISDIYGFMVAGFLVTMGTLGDRIGRRRLLMIGAAGFAAASGLAAFAQTAEQLILARALLGIAGATLAPSTLSLIRNMFHDPNQRRFAIGVWVASFSAGSALGPLIGGLLLAWFWWGSIFLIAIPVMLLLLVAAPVLLPESRDPEAGSMDLASVLLSLSAVLGVIYALKRTAEQNADIFVLLVLAAGVAAAVMFARRQRKLQDPFIDFSLFRHAAFSASLGINVIASVLVFGTFLFVAQYLQLVLGLDPFTAGIWTLPSGLLFVVGSLFAPALVRRVSHAAVFAGCFVAAGLAFGLLTRAETENGLMFLAGFYVLSLALAPVGTLATDLVVGLAPKEKAGAAAALSETSFELGGALGIALLGSLVTALYRYSITAKGLAPDMLEVVRETLGAASALAQSLPAEAGEAVLVAARGAYLDAFRQTSVLCAVVMLLIALIAWRLLPKRNAELA